MKLFPFLVLAASVLYAFFEYCVAYQQAGLQNIGGAIQHQLLAFASVIVASIATKFLDD